MTLLLLRPRKKKYLFPVTVQGKKDRSVKKNWGIIHIYPNMCFMLIGVFNREAGFFMSKNLLGVGLQETTFLGESRL